MADTIKVFIPKQPDFTLKDEKYKITHFTFQREGDKKVEKGQHFTFNAGEAEKVRAALKTALDSEGTVEVELGEEKFGRLDVKFPSLVPPKAFGGGGGGGRPVGPPNYRGRKLSAKEYLDVYMTLKDTFAKKNAEMYRTLEPKDMAELTRSEVSQAMMMIRDNVWGPKDA